MCGLCGFIESATTADHRDILAAMTGELSHRGPDETRVHIDAGFAFGFCRLPVVDVEAGSQPMYSENGAVVAITAGEIYNHRELRDHFGGPGPRVQDAVRHRGRAAHVRRVRTGFSRHARRAIRRGAIRSGRAPVPWPREIISASYRSSTRRTDGKWCSVRRSRAILAHPDITPTVDPVGLDQVFTLPGLVSPRTMSTVFAASHRDPPGTGVGGRSAD